MKAPARRCFPILSIIALGCCLGSLRAVAQQPPAQLVVTGRTAQWLAERHLDPAAVKSGAVKAVVGGKLQTVTMAQLNVGMARTATVITRAERAPQKVPLSAAMKLLKLPTVAGNEVELPLEISGVDQESNALVKLRARIVEGTGLLMDPELRTFVDIVYVLLVDRENPGRKVTLKEPVDVMLMAVGATADPMPIKLVTTEALFAVKIKVTDPPGKTFPVTVRAGIDDAGDTVELKVVPPRVVLRAETPDIIGWGIGKTRIHVQSPTLLRADGYNVVLWTTGGDLTPSGKVHLGADGLGEVELRSDHNGSGTVSVEDATSEGSSATVTFRAPWLFLGMAAVGGLAGAFLRRKGRQRWQRALTIGVVTSVAAAVLYAVGYAPKLAEMVGAAQLAASGEALVFAIGFLAALVGVSWFVPVTKK
jgi:hypothetical protein